MLLQAGAAGDDGGAGPVRDQIGGADTLQVCQRYIEYTLTIMLAVFSAAAVELIIKGLLGFACG